jgi:hypothetical protein
VKGKGTEARNTLEEYERVREGKTLYELLGITRRTYQNHFGQCSKELIVEPYELNKRVALK